MVVYWGWILLHARLRQVPQLWKLAAITGSISLAKHYADNCRSMGEFMSQDLLMGLVVAISAVLMLPRPMAGGGRIRGT